MKGRLAGVARDRGFTLVEMLMVLTVAVVLLTLGAPAFIDTVRNNRLVTTMNALSGTLASARAEAVAQRIVVTVCGSSDGLECDGEWTQGWISFLDEDGDETVDDDETVLRRADAVPGAISVDLLGGDATVGYNSQGFLETGAATTFRVCDDRGDAHGRALLVSASGRVSVATDTDSDGIVDDVAGNNIDCP